MDNKTKWVIGEDYELRSGEKVKCIYVMDHCDYPVFILDKEDVVSRKTIEGCTNKNKPIKSNFDIIGKWEDGPRKGDKMYGYLRRNKDLFATEDSFSWHLQWEEKEVEIRADYRRSKDDDRTFE